MTNNQILKTDRLTLHPMSLDFAEDLYLVYSHPKAMRFMDTPPHTDVAETQAKIKSMMNDSACYWAICLPDGRAIGDLGYLGNPGAPGMGYILHPDFWRQGYTTEAVRAALEYGFTQRGLDRVELWINHDNEASQRLAQTLGFSRRGQFRMKYQHHTEAHDKIVYGLYRYEWQNLPAFTAKFPLSCYTIQPVLGVPDVEATATYYRDQLDFDIDFFYGDPPNHGGVSCCEWMTEGVRIQLSLNPDVDPAMSGVELYLFVGPDIDARYERYKARGVTIVREIDTMPWGLREFVIKDCNGYQLRFGTSG